MCSSRVTANGTPSAANAPVYSAIASGTQSDNFNIATLRARAAPAIPADATVIVIAGPSLDLLPPADGPAREVPWAGGKLLVWRTYQRRPADESLPTSRRCSTTGASTSATTGRGCERPRPLIGTDASVPLAAPLSGAPDCRRLQPADRLPLARSVDTGRTAVSTAGTARSVHPDRRQQLGAKRNIAEKFTIERSARSRRRKTTERVRSPSGPRCRARGGSAG